MKKRWALFLLVSLCAAEAAAEKAQKGRKDLTVATDRNPAGETAVTLCCTPSDLFTTRTTCSQVLERPAEGRELNVHVKVLCDDLRTTATVIAPTGEWYVFRKARPDEALFRINCNTELAWILESSPAPSQPASISIQPSKSAPPQSAASSGGSQPPVSQKLDGRVDALEKALKEQKAAVRGLEEELKLRSAAHREMEKKLEDLRSEMLDKLRALGEAQKNSACYRIDDQYQGREEVTVAVAGSVLRFLKVKPQAATVPIGIAEEKANELLAEAQAQSSKKIFPHIYLAVPEKVREVKPFFLQDRLIDPQLYSRLTGGKDADRVSYQDVDRFVADLNARCTGKARFALPTEEQFVAAAQRLYDPIANGLKPCDALRTEDLRSDITELFGRDWQLTRSPCQPFSEPPKMTCPDSSSYIRKGGAISSTNPLECMPEYRSPAPFDVNQKETSFRLVLAD